MKKEKKKKAELCSIKLMFAQTHMKVAVVMETPKKMDT